MLLVSLKTGQKEYEIAADPRIGILKKVSQGLLSLCLSLLFCSPKSLLESPLSSPCSRPAIVLLRTPLLCISLISPVIGQEVSWHIMNLCARCLIQHLQVFKDCLVDLVQITGMGSNSQYR